MCIQNGLSIIEQPKGHSKSYNKWLGNEAKTSQRDVLREALDDALARQPKDFEELLEQLKQEEETCESCPDRNAPADRCEGCGTHGNIRDLEQLIASMEN